MKLSILSVGALGLVGSLIGSLIGQSPAQAGSKTCTTDGTTWECTEDDTSTEPSCVGDGPFECSEPAPAGLTSSLLTQDNKVIWGDVEIALTCKLNEQLVVDDKGNESCVSRTPELYMSYRPDLFQM